MFVRIRFAKYGVLKYIGHLDVMRYFQKAIRRAKLDVVYSQGYHPHQIMSFALPLGVGVTSDGEYMDIELNSLPEQGGLQAAVDALNAVMTDGICVLDAAQISEGTDTEHIKSAMSLVAAADYYINFRQKQASGLSSQVELKERFDAFISQESITISKKTKKSEREVDLLPYIYKAAYDCESFFDGSDESKTALTHADEQETDMKLFLRLSAGSVMNVKPELVVEAFYGFLGKEFDRFDIHLHRMNMYAGDAKKVEALL